jgi:hypothetical protein
MSTSLQTLTTTTNATVTYAENSIKINFSQVSARVHQCTRTYSRHTPVRLRRVRRTLAAHKQAAVAMRLARRHYLGRASAVSSSASPPLNSPRTPSTTNACVWLRRSTCSQPVSVQPHTVCTPQHTRTAVNGGRAVGCRTTRAVHLVKDNSRCSARP